MVQIHMVCQIRQKIVSIFLYREIHVLLSARHNMFGLRILLYNRCKGYYPYDTEDNNGCSEKIKRKTYSKEERKSIYNKAGGRCELCGCRLVLEDMTLDHIVPLSMGGEDSMKNLQTACYACNRFKSNILPDDFMDRIIKIFLYQTEQKCSKDIKLKIIHKLVESLQ